MITCTFAGHREVFGSCTQKIENALETLIENEDTLYCYVGGMGEFDGFSAAAVRNLKRKYPNKEIRLTLVLPYMQQKLNEYKEYYETSFDDILIPAELAEIHYKRAIKDLLYGILLPSGAECCMAFADRIAGSEEAFVDMMNEKATEIGMSNTHFCNATGLHNPDHYSTVKDISILLKYALQYEDFRQAFSSSRYSTRPTNQHPDGFTFRSTMFKYMDSTEVVGGEIIGGKTGYTEEAGLCLASLAEVDGKEYILVTAKANGTHQTEQFHILDAINVYSQIGELNITN